MIAVLTGTIFVLFKVGSLAQQRKKAYESRHKAHLDKYADWLHAAEERDTELINRIDEEWDAYCVHFTGYPPDWKYRVMTVLERDGHTCTKCGWPNGVKRKVRQLHVHHVQSHSRGGNHAISNLVTLCDICHGMQEGRGHNRIKPRRRKKGGALKRDGHD
jgi:5-methylcytosine-specific restriction endonuclease McrA